MKIEDRIEEVLMEGDGYGIGDNVKLKKPVNGYYFFSIKGFKFAPDAKMGKVPGMGVAPLPGSKVEVLMGTLGTSAYTASGGGGGPIIRAEVSLDNIEMKVR